MAELLNAVLDAHGGLDHSREVRRVEATIVTGGDLWAIKGQQEDPAPRHMAAALDHEWASVSPFSADDQKTDFTPDRVAIEKLDGRVVVKRDNAVHSFDGHTFATPWDALQRAYFSHVDVPHHALLADDARCAVSEISVVHDNGETWQGPQAQFPHEIASQSRVQEFYFDDDFLLRRHDYRVEVAGGFAAVQYVADILEADVIKLPSRRNGPPGRRAR
ncbi:MAG TPA: hypothetical protein VFK56_10190 [Mycobacterium sp.]|nr:hypothetical protein [Mycobacterium sp.]